MYICHKIVKFEFISDVDRPYQMIFIWISNTGVEVSDVQKCLGLNVDASVHTPLHTFFDEATFEAKANTNDCIKTGGGGLTGKYGLVV